MRKKGYNCAGKTASVYYLIMCDLIVGVIVVYMRLLCLGEIGPLLFYCKRRAFLSIIFQLFSPNNSRRQILCFMVISSANAYEGYYGIVIEISICFCIAY